MNPTLSLSHGPWLAKIHLLRGGNCIALQNSRYGASLLREPPENGVLDNPYLYGMPILFPVNRISGGEFTFEGRRYRFPINEPQTNCHLHGELHQMPFVLTEQSPSHLSCRYEAKEGEYLGFPHAFSLSLEYRLQEEGLCHTVTVENRSEENMPVLLGFHTTFRTPFCPQGRGEDLRVKAELQEEYRRNMERDYLPTGEKLPFDQVSRALCEGSFPPYSQKISRHYRGVGEMSITDQKAGLRIRYQIDEKFPFRLIYNGGSEGYLCLEPQTCLANCPNAPFSREEAGFVFLPPHQSLCYRCNIGLEEI